LIIPQRRYLDVQAHVEGKAVLAMLKTNVHDHTVYKVKLDELRILVKTLDIEVKRDFVQTRHRPFSKFYIGTGKVKEITKYVRRHDINIVVFYNNLRSSQKLNLVRAFGCDVVDRYEVTLEIFDKMASDNLSKLQIEAARLQKLTPFFKLSASMRYSNDRPFFRSMGEYGFHRQLRELTRKQARIRKEIEALTKVNRQRIEKRKKLGMPSVCISGYYNAGKTSLFNSLTGDDKLVSDRPFTTLSSKYQRRYIDPETSLLFIDTIGFVIDLDPNLIRSFQLNMDDMRNADLVILLIDISDPVLTLRIKLVEGIRLLRQLEIPRDRIFVVFNKVDLPHPNLDELMVELNLEHIDLPWFMVSAKKRENLNQLLMALKDRISYLENPPPESETEKVELVEEDP
jgi:GTP-binding protein HflX